MKKFAISILVVAFVLMSASIVLADLHSRQVVNTAPTGFMGNISPNNCIDGSGDECLILSWNPITTSASSWQKMMGYALEVKAQYASGTSSCPDTVLTKTTYIRASSCTTMCTTPPIDLTAPLPGYKLISVHSSVMGEVFGLSVSNGAKSVMTIDVNSCTPNY